MAKRRRQTTATPRTGRRATPAQQRDSAREHVSRAEREARLQRRVLIGTGVTIALVVLLLLGAVVIELLVTPNSVAAEVAGETITIAAFQERARLERAILNTRINNYATLLSDSGLDLNQFVGQEPLRSWLAQVENPDQLGTAVLDIMIEDILIRQEAATRGLSVSPEQIDAQIDQFLGLELPPQEPDAAAADPQPTLVPSPTRTPFVSPTPRPQPSATVTPVAAQLTPTATIAANATATLTPVPATPTATYEERREEQLVVRERILDDLTVSARISEQRLTQFFEALALRNALAAALSGPDDSLPYVNARHILVADEATAADLMAALGEGESFASLAMANSLDTASGRNGGELGWAPASNYVRPFAEAVLAAAPGATLGPVESEFGWHIIQLRAREARVATAAQLENAREVTLQNWLQDQRAAQEETINISDIWAENVPDEPILLLTGPG